jgi:hypothetical protein
MPRAVGPLARLCANSTPLYNAWSADKKSQLVEVLHGTDVTLAPGRQ